MLLARSAATLAIYACFVTEPSAAEEPRRTPEIAEVIVRHAARECFARLIHASGYLVPRSSAVVMLNAPGYRIVEVRAKVGDSIKQGDVLARAAPAQPPPAGKPDASADVPLTAMASGTILQTTAFVGEQTSQTAKPLFTIAVDSMIEAAVAVPSGRVPELQVGQLAEVTLRDGSVLHGRLRRTPPVIDAASQTGTARLSLDARGGLEPGSFVLATIEARRSCGIGVPIAALHRTSTGTTLQVLENDEIASRAVTLGLANETDSEVTSGLAEGDVIVAGAGASREGDHVRPIFADPQDAR